MKGDDKREPPFDAAESKTPSMRGNSMRENRETQATAPSDGGGARSGKANRRTPDTHVAGESDGPIVPAKRANKAGVSAAAESVEERGPTKGNATGTAARRTQGRTSVSNGLGRVREAARSARHQPEVGAV